MARSDLLIALIRAASAGDRESMRRTVEALAADERAKKHFGLADRLERALASAAPSTTTIAGSATALANHGRDAILEVEPRVRLEELVLTPIASSLGRQLIEEHIRADLLRSHGYEPRHRILLSGPPGNGKTSFAEAIAEELALPFYVVRYDALIGSFLGETNTRLRQLFDYVRTHPSVLFFDEFDSIGKERGDTHETGEIKRVVSFLLMQLDQLPSYVIVTAATNHAELLDRAVWRRFQVRLAFPPPTRTQVSEFIDRTFADWPEASAISSKDIARNLEGTSYAEVADFCHNIRRRYILGMGERRIDDIVRDEIRLWSTRVHPEAINGKRPDKASAASRAKPPHKSRNRHP